MKKVENTIQLIRVTIAYIIVLVVMIVMIILMTVFPYLLIWWVISQIDN